MTTTRRAHPHQAATCSICGYSARRTSTIEDHMLIAHRAPRAPKQLTEPVPFYNPELPDSEQPDFREEPMTRPCYACGNFDGQTAPERPVIGLFICNPADPTQAYRLSCGHSTIDA